MQVLNNILYISFGSAGDVISLLLHRIEVQLL